MGIVFLQPGFIETQVLLSGVRFVDYDDHRAVAAAVGSFSSNR